METKSLSSDALATIDQYSHFKIGQAVCSVPYFNNKTRGSRGGLRVNSGKGSSKDIFDEVETIILKTRVDLKALQNDGLKKILVDNNVGIDCSGFAYYILDAESKNRKHGSLSKNITFMRTRGILGSIRSTLNPAGNCDVATLADDTNSKDVATKNIRPGDFISMIASTEQGERNHILVIHQVEYNDSLPTKIFYSHAVAYPEDGIYGSGIKQGSIEITHPEKTILDQHWTENSLEGTSNRIFVRAKNSTTVVKRLRWF